MKPDLLLPRDMPRRGKAQTLAGRIALLHAIAHIERNAVDLAADILVRFPDADAPLEFYNDWLGVRVLENGLGPFSWNIELVK